MLLATCALPTCGGGFWKEPDSEKQYCCKECANASRRAKVTAASVNYDPAKARAARTAKSFQKQAESLRTNWANRQKSKWFDQLSVERQNMLRVKLADKLRQRPSVIPLTTGSIRAHGLRFDSRVELYVYEELTRRGEMLERSVPYNGWLVDFGAQKREILLEIKSVYTATRLQDTAEVLARCDDNVFLLEEGDAYRINEVDDIWGYIGDRSEAFKSSLQLLI